MNSSGKRLRQPGLIVYFSGVGTSALVLWLVHYLNDSQQFNVMGWYVNVELKKCPSCDAHHLKLTLANFTADKQAATTIVAQIDKTESTTTEAT